MNIERDEHGCWWIRDIPGGGDCGPYDTKQEAADDRIGLARFAAANPKILEAFETLTLGERIDHGPRLECGP